MIDALLKALMLAKKRKPAQKDERQPGQGTNENGPPVETNYPPNAWPSDGDHD